MSYAPGSAYYAEFITVLAGSIPTDATGTPVATANRNGVDDAAFVLTCSNLDTGRYKVTGTIPTTYSAGDIVIVSVSTIVATNAGKQIVDTFTVGYVYAASSVPAPGGTDLTTVADAKSFMGIASAVTTWDTWIQTLVTAVSNRIECVTARNLMARDYMERYSGNHERRIRLRNWPVNSISRIGYGFANAISVTADPGTFLVATLSVIVPTAGTTGSLSLYTVALTGTAATTAFSFGTYKITDTLVTALNLISGITAMLQDSVPTPTLNPIAGCGCLGQTQFITWPDRDLDVDYLDADRGLLGYATSGWPEYYGDQIYPGMGTQLGSAEMRMPVAGRGFLNYLIQYNAGYTTAPADIAMAANQIVKTMFDQAKVSGALKSESLGDWSYTVLDQLAIDNAAKSMLDFETEIR